MGGIAAAIFSGGDGGGKKKPKPKPQKETKPAEKDNTSKLRAAITDQPSLFEELGTKQNKAQL